MTSTRQLRREHFSRYTEHELSRGLKPKAVANNLQILKRAVLWGIDEQLLEEKLARSFPRVKVPKSRRRVLSPEEMESLLELLADDPLYPVVLTALYTGMRRGELMGLRCEHVDLEAGIINLCRLLTSSTITAALRLIR